MILKYYDSLLKLDESNKNSEFDEMRVREDELNYDPKEEEEKSKKYADNKRVAKIDSVYNQNLRFLPFEYPYLLHIYTNKLLNMLLVVP